VSFYSPGQTAERSGFSIDTLRYYERIGLLEGVERTAGGRRRFSDDDLAWLGVLRCLRDTGMPIAEMLRYAELARDESTLLERIRLLEAHDRRVAQQITQLCDQQRHIRAKVAHYRGLAS
jgi:DNA-binding transcriptional MerR regulator